MNRASFDATGPLPVLAADRDTRACPVCGAANLSARILCGACGADLDTGDPQVTVAAWPATRSGLTGADERDERSPRRRGPVLLGVGLGLAALVVTLLAIVGPGWFGGAGDGPRFDVLRYAKAAERLTLTDVAVQSVHPAQGERTFTPDHLVDGDPTTAWLGHAASLPAGVTEKIDLYLDEPAWVSALVVENGDHLDAQHYAASARAQRAVLVFDGAVRVPVTFLDQGLQPQIVELTEPLLTASVRIEIVDTVAGTERADVALTRVELSGHPALGDDVRVAEERATLRPATGAVLIPR